MGSGFRSRLAGMALAIVLAGCRGAGNCGSTGMTGATTAPAPSPPPPTTGPPPPGIMAVNHVVILIQEDHSFDNYFGQMTAYRRANGIPINGLPATIDDLSTGTFSNFSPATGTMIALHHTGSMCTEDLTPDWTESHKDFNLQNPVAAGPTSPMDGFVSVAFQISQFAATLGIQMVDQDGHRAIGFFDGNDLNYYYFMASQFAMGDHFYAPVPGNTPVNRHFGQAATSQGFVHDVGRGTLTATPIWQELQSKGISWKIYVAENTLFTFLEDFAFFNQQGVAAHVVPLAQYFSDAAAGKLPAVSFVETGLHIGISEHPSNFDPANPQLGEVPINVQVGAQWASGVINALMQGPSWSDSVLFFAYDEGGATFDHVPPMAVPNPDGIKPVDLKPNDVPGDFTITGSRVPN